MEPLTDKRMFELIEQLVERRMEATGETKPEATNHLVAYLTSRIDENAA